MKEEIYIQKEGEQQPVRLSSVFADFVAYATRSGKLPPTGNSPEEQARRQEWERANLNPVRKTY